MIVLSRSDVLRGDASTASKVDYTVYGYDKVRENPASLADGQLAASETDILDAAGVVRVIDYISFVNTHTSAITVNLYVKRDGGTSRRILPKDTSIGTNKCLEIHKNGVTVWG